jgi:hypothetical protein
MHSNNFLWPNTAKNKTTKIVILNDFCLIFDVMRELKNLTENNAISTAWSSRQKLS